MSDTSHISGPSEDDRVLMAEYVLGLLSAEEHARVAARLRDDASLRAEERVWKLRLQTLDREFVETAPPSAVLARLEQRLFADERQAAGGSWWDSLALWRALTTGGVAVAAVAIGMNLMAPRPDPQAFAAELVAALHAEGSNVSFVALYNSDSGELRLTPLSGEQHTDQDYELWAIEDGGPAKSMGVIAANARNDVKIAPDILVDFGQGTTLAVTLEQKGGSPTGSAQGPIVAVGTATPI